tara:strand:- start:7501 stop:10494 length:2994 start_codon:yes stop_codon:yes gene_type:complete
VRYVIFILFSFIFSQSWYNHTELNWRTFETDHFIFHYHEGTENTVSEAAFVAEKIYKPITDYYDFRPKTKTVIIIKDTDDISNGTAFYYDNKLEIWAHPLDFDLRGSHRWLQNVITHEFTHIIQIGSSMKASTRFPAIYFQGFGYEQEKRKDVLYGYPNLMFSMPIPGVAVPPWLAEGTAQYMSPELHYDFWDSHRDMLLRDMTINNKLLSFNQMNSFGKKGIGSEAVYNQGWAFSNYLTNRFGSDILPKISKILATKTFSVNKAIFESTNSKYNGYELYLDWVKTIGQDYEVQLQNVSNNLVEGTVIESKGTTNLFPKWSPDGTKIAYISNQDNDYFGQTDLFIYNLLDSTKNKLISGSKYAPCWINDSTLIFTLRSKPNKHGSKYFDLYKMSLNQEEPDQLTENQRLRSPIFNARNNLIAAISTVDGLSNIYISDIDSINFIKITDFNNQEYISSINWDFNQDKIVMDVIINHGRDIYEVDINSKKTLKIIDQTNDIRNPIIEDDKLYFSQDHNGIFNISYQENDEIKFLTNVFGGAFMPDIKKNKLVYSLYHDGAYKIAVINNLNEISKDVIGYISPIQYNTSNLDVPQNLDLHKNSLPYSNNMTQLHIVPRIMFDYLDNDTKLKDLSNNTKYGFYAFADDFIGQLSLFGGFSINQIQDIDAMLMFEYKKFYPTFYTNLFWASRNTNQVFEYYTVDSLLVENISIDNDVDYHLFSADLGTRFSKFDFKFWLNYNYVNYNQKIFQTIKQEYLSNGNQTLVGYGKLGFDYYKGHILSIRALSRKIKPQFLGNMIPRNGYIFDITLGYEWNNFMDGLDFSDYGTYVSVLQPNNTSRFDLKFQWFGYLEKHKISVENNFRLAFIGNRNIDDFFHFNGGGMTGLKGYTFYDKELTGWGLIAQSIYFRTLIMDKQYLGFKDFIGFNKLSLGFVAQYGDAISNGVPKLSSGFELRAKGFLFYGYPAAVTLEQHYPVVLDGLRFFDIDIYESKTYLRLLFNF